MKKQIKVTNDGVSIIDEELMKEVKRKNMSPSMVSSFFNCPADWLIDSFIIPQVEHTEPHFFERGHIFHEIMEGLYALPEEERTKENVNKITNEILKADYAHVLTDNETKEWIKNAVIGFYSLGIDPRSEVVSIQKTPVRKYIAKIKDEEGNEVEKEMPYKEIKEKGLKYRVEEVIEEQPGIEIFVKGKLSDTNRQVVGFVDMLVEDEANKDGVVVRDWKTGGKIHPFDPEKPIGRNNDFGYWRQQLTYSMLLEQDGVNVTGAELIFPVAEGVVDIDVSNDKLKEQVIKDYELLDQALDRCIEENFFPFKGHFFCTWCGTFSTKFRQPRRKPQVNYQEFIQLIEFEE